jgi:hypothetical protein
MVERCSASRFEAASRLVVLVEASTKAALRAGGRVSGKAAGF